MEAVLNHGRPVLPAAPRVASISDVTNREVTDGELLERVGAGDRDAFDELYRRYTRPVLGLALRRLGDRGRAEDAAQDAFAAVWRSAHSYDPERGTGAAWLYTVARNAIVDGARRRPEPPVETPDDEPAAGAGPDERAEISWLAWRVHRAIEELPGARAARDRARVLERAVSERDRRAFAGPARHGQDADSDRARAAGRPARGRAAVKQLDDLIGGPEGLSAEEYARLRRRARAAARGACASRRASPAPSGHRVAPAAAPPSLGARADRRRAAPRDLRGWVPPRDWRRPGGRQDDPDERRRRGARGLGHDRPARGGSGGQLADGRARQRPRADRRHRGLVRALADEGRRGDRLLRPVHCRRGRDDGAAERALQAPRLRRLDRDAPRLGRAAASPT